MRLDDRAGAEMERTIEVHGHRGSRATHPDNTFAGFEEAWRVGAPWFEIDVRPTLEDELVVFHDPTVNATNARRLDGGIVDGDVPVVAMTRAELDRFDVGFPRTARFPEQRPVWGSRIPSLVDVFRWLGRHPRIAVNVELKADGIAGDDGTLERYARRVSDALAAVPEGGRVMVQSFEPRLVAFLKRRHPSLRTAVLFETPEDFFRVARQTGADGIGPNERFVDAALGARCRREGLKLVPWTVNDPARWQALIAMGVHGIITDYPERLLKSL
jgi:glycerophosphoryl diester phosphodiesterase